MYYVRVGGLMIDLLSFSISGEIWIPTWRGKQSVDNVYGSLFAYLFMG